MIMQIESSLEKRLVDQIKKLGGLCIKWTSPSLNGLPDRIVILPGGRVEFVELKSGRGKRKALQEYRKKELEGLGCRVELVSGDEGVESYIRKLEERLQNDI